MYSLHVKDKPKTGGQEIKNVQKSGAVKMQSQIILYVNGKRIVEENPDPEWTLSYYLRDKLLVKGTKISCGEAQCGGCTNMVSKYDQKTKTVKHSAVHGCLIPLVSLNGCAITTVEGIGSVKDGLHPVQERLAKRHGAQCGFCTPGFVMSMYALLRNNPKPSTEEVENAIGGNLCRCTGYRPILEAFYSFSEDKCPCGFQGECCKSKEKGSTASKESVLSSWEHLKPYDSSQDPIFPMELMNYTNGELKCIGERVSYFRPKSLTSLFDTMNKYPDARIVGSAAYTGMMERLTNSPNKTLISVSSVEELQVVNASDKSVTVGSALTIADLEHCLKEFSKSNKSDTVQLFVQTIPAIGSTQLRNYVSWSGNVGSAWHISDLSICLMVTGSSLEIMSSDRKQRTIPVDNKFFLDKAKVNLKKNEIITALSIPTKQDSSSLEHSYFSDKQGQRHGHDSAIVNAAGKISIDKKEMKLKEVAFAFGGVANRPYMVTFKPDGDLKKNKEAVWQSVMKTVETELDKVIDKSTGKAEYRITLAASLVFKFLMLAQQKIEGDSRDIVNHPKHPPVEGVQFAQEVLSGQPPADPVGRPIMHNSIEKHTTGQSIYIDDMPPQLNEVHLALVKSTCAHGNIVSVDYKEACSIPGVVGWVDIKDIPEKGSNYPGAKEHMLDTPIFAETEVNCIGQTIGGILAENPYLARRAGLLVKVVYQELPAIFSIAKALEMGQILPPVHKVNRGDVETAFKESEHTLSGECRLESQEHFYMEPQSCLVVPKDGNEYEIYSSTQSPSLIQSQASFATGVPQGKIVCKVKRIGGGFGGKGEQPALVAWPAMIAAYKYQRPVRIIFNREEDMTVTGKRSPFLYKYKVAFEKDGTIKAIQANSYMGSGYKLGHNAFVISHAIENMDSGYNIPNVNVDGTALKTNLPYNTVMRGAGQPEGHYLMECIIEQVAQYLNIDAFEIRKKHLYKDGDVSLHNVPLDTCTLDRCWDECVRMSQYNERRKEIEQFNKDNPYKKRGISTVTVKTGVGMADSPFDQGAVLVNIYTDGSVQLSHGGVEMGQGLVTKLLQVASRCLKIPVENITTIEAGTDKVPNTMPTGGSVGVDTYGPAVQEACNTLLQRLEPYMFKNPKGTFEHWVKAAAMSRVSLSATGFCKPFVHNPDGKRTFKPRYYVYGVGCSEVEIDCLTGDHYVLKSDVVMDFAQSLNPAIDIGQIEGAFMQAYGLTTMEEILYAPDGRLITNSAMTYKIPNVRTVPKKFCVSLLKNDAYEGTFLSSKGVGEPPFTLGYSVYFAIMDAVRAARQEAGIEGLFQIDSPATPEKIRMAVSKTKL